MHCISCHFVLHLEIYNREQEEKKQADLPANL
jgi:hypothetical protein